MRGTRRSGQAGHRPARRDRDGMTNRWCVHQREVSRRGLPARRHRDPSSRRTDPAGLRGRKPPERLHGAGRPGSSCSATMGQRVGQDARYNGPVKESSIVGTGVRAVLARQPPGVPLASRASHSGQFPVTRPFRAGCPPTRARSRGPCGRGGRSRQRARPIVSIERRSRTSCTSHTKRAEPEAIGQARRCPRSTSRWGGD